MSTILEFKDVSYAPSGLEVLKGISLKVRRGEVVGIIGPNGAGKTTLLKIALGLINDHSGQVELFGRPKQEFSSWDKVAYMPQRVSIEKTTMVTVDDFLGARGVKPPPGLEGKLLSQLSGGQLQRVLFSYAYSKKPELLLLDEPTAGTDAEQEERMHRMIKEVRGRGSVVLVSHDLSFISSLVDRMVCLNHSVLFCGSPQKMTMAGLKRLYSKNFMGVAHSHGF
ncbi:MAG: metal ABC transporter ATP-binding protein [Candidatus Anstonellales archaeon]